MGLDVFLIRERDYEDGVWTINGEICYGRKIWQTVDWLTEHPDCEELEEQYSYLINKKVWNDFYHTFNKHKWKMKLFTSLIEKYESMEYLSKFQKKLLEYSYNRLHSILDPILKPGGSEFFSGYTLGVDWEAATICKWLDKNKKIQKILENDNLVLILDF